MPPADLNGLVRFAGRRNLVSARVPSRFKRGLQPIVLTYTQLNHPYKTLHPLLGEMMNKNINQNMISDFRHGVHYIFVLQERYAAQIGSELRTFQENPSIPSSRVVECNKNGWICGNKMPTTCNRGFYCRSYCLLNMFRAPLCPSSGAQEYYTVVAACGISCCKNLKITHDN